MESNVQKVGTESSTPTALSASRFPQEVAASRIRDSGTDSRCNAMIRRTRLKNVGNTHSPQPG